MPIWIINIKNGNTMKIPLLAFNDNGIYCQQADVYLDPWKPVKNAIITHGHSDHARWGHQNYITHHTNIPIIRHRLGEINVTGKDWGETFVINNVKIFITSCRTYYWKFSNSGRAQRRSVGFYRRL